jgi:hypothetical protein
MNMPTHRMLRGYTIDPGFSTQLNTMGINESVYKVKWENLLPGPLGEYIEVIDIDPANNCLYDPVNLDSKEILAHHGLTPSEGNAQFHQQFVYAVIMQTIENFEKALGRKIIWRAHISRVKGKIKENYVGQLRVYPHAMREANAYYTSEKIALLFGYFQAGTKTQGSNFPGGAVFTCLSPDIVAHETTHAILDSIFPRYLEDTNADVPAFHEAFADIVALLQRFSNSKLVEHQLEQTRGRLDEYSLLGELATQFGQALETGRGALRSAIGEYDKKARKWTRIEPNPLAYQNTMEAHDRGAILVATIFDSFLRLYNFRIKDLLRIATQGTGMLPEGSINPDLVKRLANEASEIASHLLSVCIRALDYCPPFDITFGNYLRALITADTDICPDDNNGYRVALIEAFRAWGIFPEQVNTLSVYSLRWGPPDFNLTEIRAMEMIAESIKEDVRKISRLSNRKKIWEDYNIVQAKLQKLLVNPQRQNPNLWKKYKLNDKIWKSFLQKIGIVLKPFTVKSGKDSFQFNGDTPLEVHGVRPAFRIGREDSQIEQVIITLTQSHKISKEPMKGLKFRGGCTIVLSISNDMLKADYIIVKSSDSTRRLSSQYQYQVNGFMNSESSASIYESVDKNGLINFEKLHIH